MSKRPKKDTAPVVDKEEGKRWARALLAPDTAAFRVAYAVYGEDLKSSTGDYKFVTDSLNNDAAKIHGGDMGLPEAMLINQATALQLLFGNLTELGMKQENMANISGLMKLALRAQNQCRATLETLSTIKNPPVVFAKQANITNGPQQVNNGCELPRAKDNEIEQTQVLENKPYERLDFGETAEAGRDDQELATVGKINRAENT